MSDPATLVAILAAAVISLAMLSLAILKGWDGWLQLRRMEIDRAEKGRAPTPAQARIELADLKDRVKRLEAIANGVEE